MEFYDAGALVARFEDEFARRLEDGTLAYDAETRTELVSGINAYGQLVAVALPSLDESAKFETLDDPLRFLVTIAHPDDTPDGVVFEVALLKSGAALIPGQGRLVAGPDTEKLFDVDYAFGGSLE